MKLEKSPVRWADGGATPELQHLLRQAETDQPSKRELLKLSALLGMGTALHVGAAAHAGALSASGTGAAAAGGAGTAAAGAAQGAASGFGTAVWLKSLGVVALIAAGAASYGLLAPEHEAAVLPNVSEQKAAPAAKNAPPPSPKAAEALLPAASAVPDTDSPQPAPSVAQTPPRSGTNNATAPTELSLLSAARRALKTNPQEALRLAKQHEKRFPNGQLRQEREVIVIEALRLSGQTDNARARGEQFEKRYPNSAHKNKVKESAGP